MYRLFCCRSRKTSRVEVDEITDSIETCLSLERGVSEFRAFLQARAFEKELTTLAFVLKCQSILTELFRLSPVTREQRLPARIQNDITELYGMTDDINFDLNQMNTLSNLNLSEVGIGEKMHIIETARAWAIDLLREGYRTFRDETLGRV